MNRNFALLCAFGDSFSDNGFSDGHGFRRYSETSTWVEYLAQMLDIPITDRAYGGATSGERNYNHPVGVDWSGLTWQVAEFLKEPHHSPAIPEMLFTVMCSLNDVLAGVTDPAEPARNIQNSVEALAGAGARSIIYREHSIALKCPGFDTPEFADLYEPSVKMIGEINAITRRDLLKNLAQRHPELKILYLSSDELFQKIKDGAPGFKCQNISQPWLGTYSYPAPFSYAWYDDWHPSGTVHKLLAEETFTALRKFLA